ncbi:hypothetical protein B0I37DRAFT_76155 [Chaetomium sp. MPI-CAGE-AT-0009]|nr:hypothetical protein B0I37DRAFT_76155 [Chaetomium sp. MPI-CAGE-AT-0009]
MQDRVGTASASTTLPSLVRPSTPYLLEIASSLSRPSTRTQISICLGATQERAAKQGMANRLAVQRGGNRMGRRARGLSHAVRCPSLLISIDILQTITWGNRMRALCWSEKRDNPHGRPQGYRGQGGGPLPHPARANAYIALSRRILWALRPVKHEGLPQQINDVRRAVRPLLWGASGEANTAVGASAGALSTRTSKRPNRE